MKNFSQISITWNARENISTRTEVQFWKQNLATSDYDLMQWWKFRYWCYSTDEIYLKFSGIWYQEKSEDTYVQRETFCAWLISNTIQFLSRLSVEFCHMER